MERRRRLIGITANPRLPMITRAGSTWGAAAAKRVPPTSSTTTPPTAMTALLGTAENHPAASASTRGRPRAIRKSTRHVIRPPNALKTPYASSETPATSGA